MAKLNLQQQPKDREYLECFRARPGHKIVQLDFDAIEPKVNAYFSRDTALLKLYGPEAQPNDVYLFSACQMGKLGTSILATGYDPDNPTPETINRAKKLCKLERSIAKKFVLSSNYGAGPGKIHQSLLMDGVDVSFAECKQYHRAFWEMHQGIKTFESNLKMLHYRNNGWIYNGFVRPLAIADNKTKDIVNRFIQSTAHDVLMRFLFLFQQEAKDLPWHPWLIDFHDETMVEVPEDRAEDVAIALARSVDRLNNELGWDIPMTGTPEIGSTLADFKCED